MDYGIRKDKNSIRWNGTCNIRQRFHDPYICQLTREFESRVESLENDLDNKDDPLSFFLDCMSIELDTKYKQLCKKHNYVPENEDEKKGKRRNNNHGTALAAS